MAYKTGPIIGSKLFFRPGTLPTIFMFGSCSVGISYYLKNTFLLQFCKSRMQLKELNGRVEPSDNLKKIFNEVNIDLKNYINEKTTVKPFITTGLKTWNGGTIGTVSGGYVGLPEFFEFKSEEDVTMKLTVKKEEYSEENDKGYCNSFLLSVKAKKYAIAREILLINTYKVYITLLFPVGVTYLACLASQKLMLFFQIAFQPLYTRALFYACLSIVTFKLLKSFYINLREYYDSEVESYIIELGQDYIEGGVEYCVKEAERNSLNIQWLQKTNVFYTISNYFQSWLSYRQSTLLQRIVYLESHLAQNKD